MSQTIKLKRSALTGKVPTTGNIDLGELAINTTDGKIFFKKDDGTETIQTILTTNAEITGALYLSGSLTASEALIGPLTFPTTDGSAGQFLKTDGVGNIGFVDGVSFPYTGSAIISSSLQVTGSFSVDGSTTTTTLSSSYIDLDVLVNGVVPSHKEGRVFYSADDGALSVYNDAVDITLQVGQEFLVRVFNPDPTNPILNGTPVRISGSQGDRPKAFPATAEDHTDSIVFENHIIGVATHDIGTNSEGYVTSQGIVRGVNTSAFAAGDVLYLQTGSPALPQDYYRNNPPPFPYDVVIAGLVARSATNGFIFVEPIEPVHFANISGLSGSINVNDGALWVYESSSGAWINSNTLPNIEASGSFSGSFQGDGSGLVGVGGIFTVSGSDVNNNQFDSEISVLQFDSSTGLNVSQSAEGTAFVSIGSHYRDIVINGQTTLVATGSDQLEFIAGDGIDLTTSMSDTNANSVSKEINFSVDNTVLRTTGDNVVSSSVQVDVTQTTNYDEVVNISGSQTIYGVKTFDANNIFNGLQTFNNINVNGTASFALIESITGSAKIIGDAYIILNNNTPSERYAGIKILDSGSAGVTASLEFDGETNDWFYEYSDDGGVTTDHGVVIFGPEYSTKGSPIYLGNNLLQKGTGGHHLADSNITDTGTLITLGSNTSITGTVVATGTTLISSSAQIATDISGAFTSTSSSIATELSSLQTASGSFSTRVSTNESNISGLQTASGSFSTRVTSNETNISNLQTDSGSFSTRVTQNESDISTNQTDISNLQTDSGSFSTRVTTNETNISNLQTDSGSFSTRITNTETSISTLEGKTLVSSSAQIDHDQTTNFSSDEHFTQANITTVGTVTAGNVTAILPSGTVSSSAQIDHDQTTNFSADEHFTQGNITTVGTVTSGNVTAILPAGTVSGSSQVSYTGLSNIPSGIVSSSAEGDGQGQIKLNGVNVNTNGLGTDDSPQFTNLTLSGDLTVNGTTTTVNSTEVEIGDRIIVLNGQDAAGDSGINVYDTATNETGSLLWDTTGNYWKGGLLGSEVKFLRTTGDSVVSSSAQIDHDQTTNFSSDEHFTQANITTVGTVTAGNVTAILPSGVVSSSAQLESTFDTRYLNTTGDSVVSSSAQISHDSTTGFVANEHIDHSLVSITAGSGLTGGGTIAETRTINVGAGDGISVAADSVAVDGTVLRTTGDNVVSSSAQILHDSTTGFVSNEHIDHSSVSISSGNGLNGGGDLTSTRTLSVGQGDGITVGTGTVAVDSTVVRTSGNQTIAGTKTFSGNVVVQGNTTIGNSSTDTLTITPATITLNQSSAGADTTINNANGASNLVLTTDSGLVKVDDDFQATGEVTAYASDDRLKNRISILENPIDKVKKLEGFTYMWNETAENLGIKNNGVKVGVSAQQVQVVLPEAVRPSPVSEEYLTVQYEKLVPLLIEGIKEQQRQIEKLQDEIEQLRNDVTR